MEAALGESTLEFLEQAVTLGMEDMDFSLLFRDIEKIKGGVKY